MTTDAVLAEPKEKQLPFSSRMSCLETDPVTRIAQLEAENVELRQKLKRQSGSGAVGHSALLEQYEDLKKRHGDLGGRYRELVKEHGKCQSYKRKAQEQYRAAKESAREWKAYNEHKRMQYARLKCAYKPPEDIAAGKDKEQGLLSCAVQGAAPGDVASSDTPVFKGQDGMAVPTAINPTNDISIEANALPADDALATQPPASSQSTLCDSAWSPPRALQPVSDGEEPVVVSARCVKRNRRSKVAAQTPIRIKQESPDEERRIELVPDDHGIPPKECYPTTQHEMSDLDAELKPFYTPKKPRRQRATTEEPPRPPPPIQSFSSLSEGDILDKSCGYSSIKPEPHGGGRVGTRDFALPTQQKKDAGTILRPRSVNVGLQSPSVNQPSSHKRRKIGSFMSKVELVSEGGQESPRQMPSKESGLRHEASASSRLADLLEASPGPTRNIIRQEDSARMPPPRRRRPISPLAKTNPPPKSGPISGTKFSSTPHFPQTKASRSTDVLQPNFLFHGRNPVIRRQAPPHLEQPPSPPRPEDEPLRSRPIATLHLEDFKVNPKYMNTTFAFADTLRGRDQRRCLRGCTRPDCCGGQFLKAVSMSAAGLVSASDRELLVQYLGPDFDTIVGELPPDKRREVLMQARASALADQHGKHRHAFERRSTPPGFWRTDFPSTQEQKADQAKALEMNKAKVAERWREAQKPDGRWVFRDE